MLEQHTLIATLVIGLVAGWLASLIMGGGGLIRDLITGLIGAFVGGFIIHGFGVTLPIHNPLVADIVISTIGAVIVVAVARAVV